MKLIFLHGMPGVGKLTVARQLEELTGFKLFHNHLTVDLVGSVFEFGSQPFVELREKIWLEVFSQAAEAGVDGLIFTFAYDRSVRRRFINKVRDGFGSSERSSFCLIDLHTGRTRKAHHRSFPAKICKANLSGAVSPIE